MSTEILEEGVRRALSETLSTSPPPAAGEIQHAHGQSTSSSASGVLFRARQLRAEGYDFLVDMVGMDWGQGRLGVIYYVANSNNPGATVTFSAEAEMHGNTAGNHNATVTSTESGEKTPIIPSVCEVWESANVLEREIHDFFGIVFEGNPDMRRLFLRADHKGYPLRKDYLRENNDVPLRDERQAEMDGVPTLDLHGLQTGRKMLFDKDEYVVNFGPQHPAMHGVLHLRVSLDGEVVRKVDPHFGYIHRGIEKMCESLAYPQMLHLAERLDYLSGTINRHGLCMCIEKAAGIEVPERAVVVRTIFDELTRVASHLLGWGSMAMDMGAVTAFIYGMRDREKVMDIFEETAGGRLMTSYCTIGGVAKDIHPGFQKRVSEFVPYMRKMLREHHLLYSNNPIARGRMDKVGFLSRDKAIALGVTGPSARASGWACDLRKEAPYAAYAKVQFDEIIRQDGMTFDRYMARLDEIEQSLRIIEQLVEGIPGGAFATSVKSVTLPEGDFFQRVENARGQFGVHITSRGGKTPWRVKFRSPSMMLVGALKHLAPTNKVADMIMLGGSLDYVIPCIDR